MKERIRERAAELGFDGCRFTTAAPPESVSHFLDWLNRGEHGEMGYLPRSAHKRGDPQLVLPGAKTVIALAASYARREGPASPTPASPAPRPVTPTFQPAPTSSPRGLIARYARYADYHDVLAERLKTLADFVNESGGTGTRSLWYTDTGPLLERDFAQRAGLGFVGKHTNLIHRGLGNWLFLAEIITTLELEPDAPERNRCGSCTRCLTACPTQAITAPFQLDARLCISYLTIELKGPIPEPLRPKIGDRIFGCDDCLAACPWNRFAREGLLMRDHARADLDGPGLLELLALSDDEFKRRFAGTPILRAKRRGLLRNVCVALGNTGDATALPALERAAQDREPLIAEHARWAIGQIQARVGAAGTGA